MKSYNQIYVEGVLRKHLDARGKTDISVMVLEDNRDPMDAIATLTKPLPTLEVHIARNQPSSYAKQVCDWLLQNHPLFMSVFKGRYV